MTATGDERPCQRCIKRNLQDACHDGVRKKAKYLHDAPTEALLPGVGARGGAGSQFLVLANMGQGQQLPPDPGYPVSSANNVVYAGQQTPTTAFPGYPPSRPQVQMPPPLTADTMMAGQQSFSTQQSPISPSFNPGPSHQASPMQNMAAVLQQNPQGTRTPLRPTYSPNMFGDDPMQYSFDPASFNFGNHYGAVEFGMLAHMSSAAAETPPGDCAAGGGHLNQAGGAGYTTPGTISTGYSGSPVNGQSFIYPQEQQHLGDWHNDAAPSMKQGGGGGGGGIQAYGNLNGPNQDPTNVFIKQEHPHGYAIGANSGSFTSPSSESSPQDIIPGFDGGSSSPPNTLYANNGSNSSNLQLRSAQPSALSTPNMKTQNLPARPARDPSTIYESMKQPYSYTKSFHRLTAFLQRRFSPQKTLRIAKALASIRPSFIACTKSLNNDDLLFMEKCLQRSLWEYEDFISGIATPTIVCRRTGEIAAVGKEFSILTGWKKDVLLGKAPNLNVNTGSPYHHRNHNKLRSAETAPKNGLPPSSSDGPEPKQPPAEEESGPQPVFLAELFDHETVIDFYEAFAQIAFGDSRGSVTAQGKLLKYKTAEDFEAEAAANLAAGCDSDEGGDSNNNNNNNSSSSSISNRPATKKRRLNLLQQHKKAAAAAQQATAGSAVYAYPVADKDGQLECTYCWTVKRDMFDIPMLIVMNVRTSFFLPLILSPRLFSFKTK